MTETKTAAPERLANALEELVERCFNRNLFPHEVKAALDALDACREESSNAST